MRYVSSLYSRVLCLLTNVCVKNNSCYILYSSQTCGMKAIYQSFHGRIFAKSSLFRFNIKFDLLSKCLYFTIKIVTKLQVLLFYIIWWMLESSIILGMLIDSPHWFFPMDVFWWLGMSARYRLRSK